MNLAARFRFLSLSIKIVAASLSGLIVVSAVQNESITVHYGV